MFAGLSLYSIEGVVQTSSSSSEGLDETVAMGMVADHFKMSSSTSATMNKKALL
jgi:hypothetical protein